MENFFLNVFFIGGGYLFGLKMILVRQLIPKKESKNQ